jgi:hypothetical protein
MQVLLDAHETAPSPVIAALGGAGSAWYDQVRPSQTAAVFAMDPSATPLLMTATHVVGSGQDTSSVLIGGPASVEGIGTLGCSPLFVSPTT